MQLPNQPTTTYRDVRFFLAFIPLANALNYYLTYSAINFNAYTAFTFLSDTLLGYLAWWAIRSIIIYCDRRLPYQPNPLKRIAIQLLLTCNAGLAIIILATEMLNALLKDTPVHPSFYRFDIFIFLIWFFVINGIYIGLHYYNLFNTSEKLRNEEKFKSEEMKARKEGFLVRQGRQNLIIPVAEVAAIYVEGEYAMVLTSSHKKHLLDLSLDKVEKQLPEDLFFRVNRQLILHRSFINGFGRGENGKLEVIVKSPESLFSPVQVSRTKASRFKSWLNQPD